MNSNLIFHPVSKRNWKQFNKGGFYNPERIRHEDGISCVNANHLREYINQNFQGRRQILVLVIDKSRLMSKSLFDEDKKAYLVKGRINMDAILDKIIIKPNKDGVFDIEVSED